MSAGTSSAAGKRAKQKFLSAKEAVGYAIGFFNGLLPRTKNVGLEEIELSSDERFCRVTLGYDSPPPRADFHPVPEVLQIPIRKLKTLEVDTRTGTVRSMRIRPMG